MILDLQAIEARLEAAPEPEKWQVEEGWEGYRVFYKDDGPGDLPIAEEICQGTDSGEALAEFIAHAPEDMKLLLDIAKRKLEDYSDFVAELVEENHTLKYQLEQIKVAISNHPNPCSKHPEDDPVSCGWKSAYIDVVETLAC